VVLEHFLAAVVEVAGQALQRAVTAVLVAQAS